MMIGQSTKLNLEREDMKKRALFLFGDIVVVDENEIGVIVKTWENVKGFTYEVYVRSYNAIFEYDENKIDRYIVRHKYLSEEELEWQNS